MRGKYRETNINIVQICSDVFMLLVAFFVSLFVFSGSMERRDFIVSAAISFVFLLIFLLASKEAKIYDATLFFYMDRFYKIITKSWCFATLLTALIMLVIAPGDHVRHFYLLFLGISYLLACLNLIMSRFIQCITHNYHAPKAAFVGIFDDFRKFNYFMNKTSMRLDELGYILPKEKSSDGLFNVLGRIDELENIIKTYDVEQIYFMQKKENNAEEMEEYINLCVEMGVSVKVILDANTLSHKTNNAISAIGTYPLITYGNHNTKRHGQIVKRVLDVVISLSGIILTSPIMVLAASAMKAETKDSVIEKQQTIGKKGRVFYRYRFRCMNGKEKKAMISKVGSFMQKTHMDALPQLFNVLQGNMSLVGTKPSSPMDVEKYKKAQWRKVAVKPGMTGAWKISEMNGIKDFNELVNLDVRYIDHWSLWLDVKIVGKTLTESFMNQNRAYTVDSRRRVLEK